ncbi:NUDIX hydrolase [Nonomuraea sp. WAC 01424]|uniref:NUDIX hydrolase n=1 Tax=Nonomuraea sp. WAC 01424 TaxID=2203200 RepID=UPI000F795140|nr:NUDIX hydrolase [Nonomuraea sp. WAC 01424]RSN03120.1 NUDIX hydrolase [Nonomuraea sp. WAC 01424]
MTTPPHTTPGKKRCDHTSVGVLISSPTGILVFERATAPVGIAPIAGHVDQHGRPEQAARAEVTEEVGLAITDLRLKLARWRPNRCRRPAIGEVGHYWWVFQARATGRLNSSVREVRAPRWAHLSQLQQYAQRTAAYASGRISEAEFTVRPGLEPVWARFLHDLRLVLLTVTPSPRSTE